MLYTLDLCKFAIILKFGLSEKGRWQCEQHSKFLFLNEISVSFNLISVQDRCLEGHLDIIRIDRNGLKGRMLGWLRSVATIINKNIIPIAINKCILHQ